MTTRYLSAALLTSSFLDASTPPGLFQVYRAGVPQHLFLVVDVEGHRRPIVLGGEQRNYYGSWQAEPDAKAWNGVSLGEVDVQVDTTQVYSEFGGEAGLGDITIAHDGVWLCCQGGGITDRRGSRIAASAGGAEGGPGHVFRRWRLIQRDTNGDAVELFARDPDAERSA